MADLVAADVTYVVNSREFVPGRGYINEVSVTFGDGADTVPTAGVPLTKASMGCPNVITKAWVEEHSAITDAFFYDYDVSANTLLALNQALAVLTTETPAATTVRMVVEGY